jgi:hypothetical protein
MVWTVIIQDTYPLSFITFKILVINIRSKIKCIIKFPINSRSRFFSLSIGKQIWSNYQENIPRFFSLNQLWVIFFKSPAGVFCDILSVINIEMNQSFNWEITIKAVIYILVSYNCFRLKTTIQIVFIFCLHYSSNIITFIIPVNLHTNSQPIEAQTQRYCYLLYSLCIKNIY